MFDFNLDFLEDIRPSLIGKVERSAISAVMAYMVKQAPNKALCFVASDSVQIQEIRAGLSFFASDTEVLEFPAWDCLPYDRVSPSTEVSAARNATLSKLINWKNQPRSHPLLVVTTANALVQRLASPAILSRWALNLKAGQSRSMDEIAQWLADHGFIHSPTVRDRGEFAVRGGIIDFFAPGEQDPVRLDFFGNSLESIRSFDLASQRTAHQLNEVQLLPVGEIKLTPETIASFRNNYLAAFGAATRDDALYQSISEGRRYAGMEHWFPMFFDELTTFFEYLDGMPVVGDHQSEKAAQDRLNQVNDHFRSRRVLLDDAEQRSAKSSADSLPYKPIEPDTLYLKVDEIRSGLAFSGPISLGPFLEPPKPDSHVIDSGCEPAPNFRSERQSGDNVFDAVRKHIAQQTGGQKSHIICAWTQGSAQRLGQVLEEHGLAKLKPIKFGNDLSELQPGQNGISILPLENGFQVGPYCFLAEQDILGDRLVRKATTRKRAADFLADLSALNPGDLVVHIDHGIGKFVGLKTINAAGAPHDCLELHYSGDDKLYLPIENIELLSRYGGEGTEVALDKLGGVNWQARKAKLKKNLLEIADQLIEIAAKRALRHAEKLVPSDGVYDEFCARFPYDETEDQLSSIEAVLDDLASGRPMDRLVCGDVGFGKTEVALRAAFVAAMSGVQVAVVVPTTLLARQHFKVFAERFKGLPLNVAHASRLVGAASLEKTKSGLKSGNIDIVVGTHALLGQSVGFKRLGLLIIDEEQRFGVKHKERLKELKSDIHVLTLSATPIPRTLQMALTGVRDLSLITTPPVDRLAVRTFISPLDPLMIREALLRERYRGGQSFYVCPRISDLAERVEFLREHVPELKFTVAHGQMTPSALDTAMNAFYEGKYDVLLSTTIVESGLDIPTANTLIVHRADMFGLAQLYQLRGRVGRSKTRAYALFTVPQHKRLTATSERRLKVLQSLDSVGAGFELASHDLDIRGSGNLLGDAQTGHLREVGYELYQQMLEEAVAELKSDGEFESTDKWSPQLNIGTAVLIPETYVNDLQLRLTLYRRLADLADLSEIDAFGAELIDRFGPMPQEVDHLLKIIYIKTLCMTANIEKMDAGPKGLVIVFRNNEFPNPAALIQWIGGQGTLAKIRPDHSIVLQRDFGDVDRRLKGVAVIAHKLAQLARSEM